MYISHEEARVHNIIQRIFTNGILDEINQGIAQSDLEYKLKLRKEDFRFLISKNILVEKENKFYPTSELIKEIEKIKSRKLNNSPEEVNEMKSKFIRIFEELRDTKKYVSKDAISLAEKIHWNILPEYEEYIIVNSEIYPNKDTKEYYNCYHTLEDLYNEIKGKGKKINSLKGDINLGIDIHVEVYTRRWGHTDSYTITRTIDGWDVSFYQKITGGKEGEALIKTLDHDYVNYPNELGTFMMHLWNRADRDEMSVEELSRHLNDIVEWINICEKNTPEGIEE